MTKFIAKSKVDGTEEPVSQLEVIRAITNNYKDPKAVLDYLLAGNEVNTPFTIFKTV